MPVTESPSAPAMTLRDVCVPERAEDTSPHRNLFPEDHNSSSAIHAGQKVPTTQCPNQMNGETVAQPHNGMLLSHKQE